MNSHLELASPVCTPNDRKGDEIIAVKEDQFGNGNLQFYGMDSVASLAANTSSVPGQFMDLSIDPDAEKVISGFLRTVTCSVVLVHKIVNGLWLVVVLQTRHKIAAMENFFSYFTIGNVAFVLYAEFFVHHVK